MTTVARSAPETLQKLYDSIIAMATGEQVQSVGHKGRTAAYNGANLTQMVKLFRSLWYADSGVPQLPSDIDDSVSLASRGCFSVRFIG